MNTIPRYEQETVISWYATDEGALIYTCDTVMLRKMDKLCEQFPDTYKCIQRDEYGARYRTSKKKFIRLGKPRAKKEDADMSEEDDDGEE